MVTWGDSRFGGQTTLIQDAGFPSSSLWPLFRFGVPKAKSRKNRGALIRGYWGSKERLRDVQQICPSSGAFAALRADGSVVTWGHAECGGISAGVHEQLHEVPYQLAILFWGFLL